MSTILTDPQLITFGNHIRANSDPTVVAALPDVAAGGAAIIRDWYNGQASPDFWVFHKYVESDEVRDVIDAQDVADMTANNRERANTLLSIRADRGFSGENSRDRSAFNDIFGGTAGEISRNAIAALWQRLANNVEQALRLNTGTGADSSNADTTSYLGEITHNEVREAISLTA